MGNIQYRSLPCIPRSTTGPAWQNGFLATLLSHFLWGEHPQMTSALRGSTVVPKNRQNCTEKLCECRGDKGVQNCILLRTSFMPRDAITGHDFFLLVESSRVKLYPTFLLLNFEMRATSAWVRKRLILFYSIKSKQFWSEGNVNGSIKLAHMLRQ